MLQSPRSVNQGCQSPGPNNSSYLYELRKLTVASNHSDSEYHNLSSDYSKGVRLCTYPGCRKVFRDLKAHMLTHQNERPQKCPIQPCAYHTRGFARRYDRNRHVLMHYHGTMVCGFCPGSGSAAEISFSRVDAFKRHLTSVHNVQQTRTNSHKRSPGESNSNIELPVYDEDATGKCSTCSGTFSNPHDFYEHLDDCVIYALQLEEPSEAINASRLAEILEDQVVLETLLNNSLPVSATSVNTPGGANERCYFDNFRVPRRSTVFDKGQGHSTRGSRGHTHAQLGVQPSTRRRKKRRHYPSSWGYPMSEMKMKKRVLCVFEGPRRLWKDDTMLCTDYELRMNIGDEKAYITDLDVQTMWRADALHGSIEEDKSPWITTVLTEMDAESFWGAIPGWISELPDMNDGSHDFSGGRNGTSYGVQKTECDNEIQKKE